MNWTTITFWVTVYLIAGVFAWILVETYLYDDAHRIGFFHYIGRVFATWIFWLPFLGGLGIYALAIWVFVIRGGDK